MDIVIPRSELSRALSITQSAVQKKTTMPILVNVLLTVTDDALKISATDLEVTAVAKASGTVKATGSTTVNSRVLNDIVRELPNTDVHLKLTKGDRLQISADTSEFLVVGVRSEEFPSLPGIALEASTKVSSPQLREMIQKTLYAVSHDETRFNLNGVCFEVEGGKKESMLRMVATDGHRLALINRPVSGLDFEGRAIVPTKGLAELRKILDEEEGEVGITLHEGFFILEGKDAKFAVRLIDGEFPDYNQVVPKKPGVPATIPAGPFAAAVKRAALMVTDKGKCVCLDFSEGKLRVSSSSPEIGQSKEELDIDYSGEPLTIGFNARYLMEFAASIGEGKPLILELSGELGPARLKSEEDESYFGIIMPMRLN